MNYTTTSWASTASNTTTSFTFVANTGTGNGTNYVAITPPETSVLPLGEPSLESEPGWLSPEGDYYPVKYLLLQRHNSIAAAIIRDLLGETPDMINDQIYLQNSGWIRIDIDSILPKNCKSNRKQRDTLSALLRLDGDDNWSKTKKMISTFAFKQARNKKEKA